MSISSPPNFNFPDTQDLSSDTDDDDNFEIEYDNNVDSAGNVVPKPSVNSTNYSSRHLFHLPFGGLPNPTALKWRRKISNRRRDKFAASACRSQSIIDFPPSTLDGSVSSSIGSFVKQQLTKPDYPSFTIIETDDECCADTGATDTMLGDYKAFTSYTACKGRTVTIGDKTLLPILGTGTAKFILNRKVIIKRNCLRVPDLCLPLYSL